MNIKADKQTIKNAKISWKFDSAFTEELFKLYDTNLDKEFSKTELLLIQDSLLAYIKPKNFLTHITYSTKIEEESRKIDIKNYELTFKNGFLSFSYEFDLNYPIIHNHKLYMEVYDDENYFIMIVEKRKQLLRIPYKIKKEQDLNSITFIINAPNLTAPESSEVSSDEEEVVEVSSIEEKDETSEKIVDKVISDDEKITKTEKEETLLEGFVKKIKFYLVEIEKGDDKWALAFLLVISFFYGVVHAMGPGHGKALAFSYFSSQKSSYFQAFIISFATAFIHIVGALVLVIISIFIIKSVFSSFLDDSILYITQTSAVLIMLLSIFILYRKLKKKSCACCACGPEDKPMFTSVKQNVNFVQNTPNQIHFKSDKKKQDLYFVLTAGLIPCPGTVVLFVYAFILKTYVSVILASIAISLGMGLVIFASSFLGVSLNKVSAKKTTIINIVEIVAPIFMFGLGLMLLLNANIF